MKTVRTFIWALAALLAATWAVAQTSIYLPVPSNIFSAKGALVVSQDLNNLTGIAAGTSGQMLVAQGAATLPSWQTVRYSASVSPAQVAANVCVDQVFTVTGVAVGDVIVANYPAGVHDSPMAMAARDSGADTVAITFCNPSAAPGTPPNGTYLFMAFGSA